MGQFQMTMLKECPSGHKKDSQTYSMTFSLHSVLSIHNPLIPIIAGILNHRFYSKYPFHRCSTTNVTQVTLRTRLIVCI